MVCPLSDMSAAMEPIVEARHKGLLPSVHVSDAYKADAGATATTGGSAPTQSQMALISDQSAWVPARDLKGVAGDFRFADISQPFQATRRRKMSTPAKPWR